ncbi:MAG: hypothetical protein ABJE66_19215 [Deltaproteobacteria bacterium]
MRTPAIQQLTSDQLDQVNGGAGFPADALGESLKLGAEGTIKAMNQSDAPSLRQGLSNFKTNVGNGMSAIGNYFNPSPGHGAPGDTYNPASLGSNGSITPGSFSAPGE